MVVFLPCHLTLRGVVVSFWRWVFTKHHHSQVGSLHFMSLDDFSKRLSDGTAVVPASVLEKAWDPISFNELMVAERIF